jgi:hypothetical protein
MTELSHPSLQPPVPGPQSKADVPDTQKLGDVTLTKDRASALVGFLRDEITLSDQRLREFFKKLILWRDFLDPKEVKKTFPWPNAANFFVQIPRTIVDALKSSAKQNILRQPKLVTADIVDLQASGLEGGEEDDAEQAFVAAAEIVGRNPSYLNISTLLDNLIEESLVGGIAPIHIRRATEVRKTTNRDLLTQETTEREIVIRKGPRVDVVPLGTWIWPSGLWTSVQEMPWVGHWTELSASALRSRATDPNFNYQNVEAAITSGGTSPAGDDTTKNRMEKIAQEPVTTVHRLYTIYLDWDMHGDKKLHSVKVIFNKAAGVIHKIEYTDGFKEYDYEVGSPRSGVIFGRGVIEPIVSMCKAINQAVNQTFDAQTLANTPSLLYPEDSPIAQLLSREGGFFPGMPLPYKEAKNEVSILEFPAPSATSFQMVAFFLQQIERITRIGPSRLGEVGVGKRTPATLGLATQQIGGELIDEYIDRVRGTLGRVLCRVFELHYIEDRGFFPRLIGETKGELINRVIQHSLENKTSLNDTLRIQLVASSATRSVELEKQNAMATAQLTFGWFEKVTQILLLYAQTTDEASRQVLLKMVEASIEQLRRMVELSDTADPEKIVPDLAELIAQVPPPPPPPQVVTEDGEPVTPPGQPPIDQGGGGEFGGLV